MTQFFARAAGCVPIVVHASARLIHSTGRTPLNNWYSNLTHFIFSHEKVVSFTLKWVICLERIAHGACGAKDWIIH